MSLLKHFYHTALWNTLICQMQCSVVRIFAVVHCNAAYQTTHHIRGRSNIMHFCIKNDKGQWNETLETQCQARQYTREQRHIYTANMSFLVHVYIEKQWKNSCVLCEQPLNETATFLSFISHHCLLFHTNATSIILQYSY